MPGLISDIDRAWEVIRVAQGFRYWASFIDAGGAAFWRFVPENGLWYLWAPIPKTWTVGVPSHADNFTASTIVGYG